MATLTKPRRWPILAPGPPAKLPGEAWQVLEPCAISWRDFKEEWLLMQRQEPNQGTPPWRWGVSPPGGRTQTEAHRPLRCMHFLRQT